MTIQSCDDSKLVTLYKNGDDSAFEELLNRHKSKVYTTIFLIVKDRYTAEDLMQEVFIKAVNTIKGGKYDEQGKFKPWIMRIAHNLSIDHFRKAKRYPTIVMEDGKNVMDTLGFADNPFEDEQINKDTKSILRRFVKQLPQSQKEVLIMRHYMKMSFKEIADATDVSINTALGRMRYALLNIRKQMQENNIAYDKNLYET